MCSSIRHIEDSGQRMGIIVGEWLWEERVWEEGGEKEFR